MLSKQDRHPLPAPHDKRAKAPPGGKRGPLKGSGDRGIIGFDCQTRETGEGSNNNAAQAEYDRLAALSYSLKSLKSSSRRFVLQGRLKVQIFFPAAGRGLDDRKRATGTC
jgi:hypothetical protein